MLSFVPSKSKTSRHNSTKKPKQHKRLNTSRKPPPKRHKHSLSKKTIQTHVKNHSTTQQTNNTNHLPRQKSHLPILSTAPSLSLTPTSPLTHTNRNFFILIDPDTILNVVLGVMGTTSTIVAGTLVGARIHQQVNSPDILYAQWRNQRVGDILASIENGGGIENTIFCHVSPNKVNSEFKFKLNRIDQSIITIPLQDYPPPDTEALITQNNGQTNQTHHNTTSQNKQQQITSNTTHPSQHTQTPIQPPQYIPPQPNDPLTFPSQQITPTFPSQNENDDEKLSESELAKNNTTLLTPCEPKTLHYNALPGQKTTKTYCLLGNYLRSTHGNEDYQNTKILCAKNESQIISNISQTIALVDAIASTYTSSLNEHQSRVLSSKFGVQFSQLTTREIISPIFIEYMKTIKNRRLLLFYQQTAFVNSMRLLYGQLETELMALSGIIYREATEVFADLSDHPSYIAPINSTTKLLLPTKDKKNLSPSSSSPNTTNTNPTPQSPPPKPWSLLPTSLNFGSYHYYQLFHPHDCFSVAEFNRRLIKYTTYSSILLEKSYELVTLARNWILYINTLTDPQVRYDFIHAPIAELNIDPLDDDSILENCEVTKKKKILHYPLSSPLPFHYAESLQVDLSAILQRRYITLCEHYNQLDIVHPVDTSSVINGDGDDDDDDVAASDYTTNTSMPTNDNDDEAGGNDDINDNNIANNNNNNNDDFEDDTDIFGSKLDTQINLVNAQLVTNKITFKDREIIRQIARNTHIEFSTKPFIPTQQPSNDEIIDLLGLEQRLEKEYQSKKEYDQYLESIDLSQTSTNTVVETNPAIATGTQTTNPVPVTNLTNATTTTTTTTTATTATATTTANNNTNNVTSPATNEKTNQSDPQNSTNGAQQDQTKEDEGQTMIDFPPPPPPPPVPEKTPSPFGPDGPKHILTTYNLPTIRRIAPSAP